VVLELYVEGALRGRKRHHRSLHEKQKDKLVVALCAQSCTLLFWLYVRFLVPHRERAPKGAARQARPRTTDKKDKFVSKLVVLVAVALCVQSSISLLWLYVLFLFHIERALRGGQRDKRGLEQQKKKDKFLSKLVV